MVKSGGQLVDLQTSCGCLEGQVCMGVRCSVFICPITLLQLTLQYGEYVDGWGIEKGAD